MTTLLFGLIGWLLFVAALVSVAWYLPRVRAEKRWRAALDAYAEREQAKWTNSKSQISEVGSQRSEI